MTDHRANSTLVASRRASKTCPSCQQDQPRLRETCSCGHEFREIATLRSNLLGRVHVSLAWTAVGLLLLTLCATVALVTSSGMWIVWLVAGVTLGMRGLKMRADARAALRRIDEAGGTIPMARLLR